MHILGSFLRQCDIEPLGDKQGSVQHHTLVGSPTVFQRWLQSQVAGNIECAIIILQHGTGDMALSNFLELGILQGILPPLYAKGFWVESI